jgi:ankyrin repeat protein
MASGNSSGQQPLALAAQAGDARLVARLLGQGRDVNEADEHGRTALHWAANQGGADVVRRLLACQEVDVNKAFAGGTTALFIASQEGHVEVVRLLLAHEEVEVNKGTRSGPRRWSLCRRRVTSRWCGSCSRTGTSR